MTRRRPKGEQLVDLRQLVAILTVTDPRHLQLHLHIREKDNLKVADALTYIFNLSQDQSRDLRILKSR